MFTTSSFTTAKNGKQLNYQVGQKVYSAYRKIWMKCLANPIPANKWMSKWGFPYGIVVKNPPANAGDERNVGSIPGSEDSLEVMATHSSVLALRIPQTEEPGRLQSMGSQRVGHDWSDLAHCCNASQLALVVKNTSANAEDLRDASSIPGLGRSTRVRNDNPLRYFCLENSMNREACCGTAHGVAKSWNRLHN